LVKHDLTDIVEHDNAIELTFTVDNGKNISGGGSDDFYQLAKGCIQIDTGKICLDKLPWRHE
jgi:hypothetical protein